MLVFKQFRVLFELFQRVLHLVEDHLAHDVHQVVVQARPVFTDSYAFQFLFKVHFRFIFLNGANKLKADFFS